MLAVWLVALCIAAGDRAQGSNAVLEYLDRVDGEARQRFREDWHRLIEIWAKDSCLDDISRDFPRSSRCGSSLLRGRRPTQEDTLVCFPEIVLPALSGTKFSYSLLGVFDGHGSDLASSISANCLHTYFLRHLYRISTAALESPVYSIFSETDDAVVRDKEVEGIFWRTIIKVALRTALIDIEEAFIKEVIQDGAIGGTTACVAIIIDDHVLVANIGDSKALICSSNDEGSDAVELSLDHHPDRSDEKIRIEASGGFVEHSGSIPRVAGILAVSRSIGDLALKKYGVISEPEFSSWRRIEIEDNYIILASDGIFETMNSQDVCAVIGSVEAGKDLSRTLKERFLTADVAIPLPPPRGTPVAAESNFCRDVFHGCILEIGISETEGRIIPGRDQIHLLADSVIDSAFELGSSDNLAAIVFALGNDTSHIRKHEDDTTKEKIISELGRLPETVIKESASLVTGVVVGRDGARFCYALTEPLHREAISPFQYNVPGRDSETAKRLCSSNFSFVLPARSEGIPASIAYDQAPCQLIDLIAAVPTDFESFASLNVSPPTGFDPAPSFILHHYRYILKKKFSRGSFGQIWLAIRKECKADEIRTGTCEWQFHEENLESAADALEGEVFVLKQIILDGQPEIRLSGLRERHFGEIFRNASRTHLLAEEGIDHIARFVDSFVTQGNLWLVFKKEGRSLSRLLYESERASELNTSESEDARMFEVLKPSQWWRWLKTSVEGQREMRNLLHQLLLAVKACHDRNITHRDLKPENMVVQESSENGTGANLILRLIDFGSAIDPFTRQHLYGTSGPTRNEHTPEYAPPEALLFEHWMHFHPHQTKAHDIWSIGVIMLEITLGTPHVFQISARTRALLDRSLAGWDEDSKNVAYMLRAFMEMCIFLPRVPPRHHRNETVNHHQEEGQLASVGCGEAALQRKIQQRDPLGLGMPDIWSFRLLRQLLQWYPEDRISVDEALSHPYFHPDLQN